jgi:hypothetical protein
LFDVLSSHIGPPAQNFILWGGTFWAMQLSLSPFAGWENDSLDPTPRADMSDVWCAWRDGNVQYRL